MVNGIYYVIIENTFCIFCNNIPSNIIVLIPSKSIKIDFYELFPELQWILGIIKTIQSQLHMLCHDF